MVARVLLSSSKRAHPNASIIFSQQSTRWNSKLELDFRVIPSQSRLLKAAISNVSLESRGHRCDTHTGVKEVRVLLPTHILSNTLIKASFKIQTKLIPAPITFIQLTLTPVTKSQRRWCEMSSCWAGLQAVGKCHDEMSAERQRFDTLKIPKICVKVSLKCIWLAWQVQSNYISTFNWYKTLMSPRAWLAFPQCN